MLTIAPCIPSNSFRCAPSEERPDREDEKDGRRECDRQRLQHRLLQVVSFAQTASEQHHSAVGPPAGDENGGLAATGVRQKLLGNDMRASIDRNRRHRRHVAEQLGALGVEQGDIVQPADVAGEAQL